MAVLLLKKKTQSQTGDVTVPILSDFATLIDELGAMQAEQEKLSKKIKELTAQQKPYMEKLKKLKEMMREVDEHDDDEEFVELGETYQAEFGKKGSSRSIKDIRKVKELMGEPTFFKVCSVALKDIDAYLNPEEKEQVLITERGLRGVTIIKRG